MLIFSQWTRLLDLLEVLLNDLGMPFLRLDGSTPIKVCGGGLCFLLFLCVLHYFYLIDLLNVRFAFG